MSENEVAQPSGPAGNSQPSTPVGSSQQPSSPAPAESNTPASSQPTTQNDFDEDDQLHLGPKKKLTSVVWDHFEKKKINGIDKAVCNYCKKQLGGESKNGTSHLHDHFRRCPRRNCVNIRQKILTANANKADGKSQVNSYSFDQECSRKELSTMIILHEYPLSIVDHVGFRRYSSSLQPLFKIPTRNTVKSDILKIYDYERTNTMKFLERNQSRVAITTDMWTSSNQKKGFMAITGHFIDDSWTLQSRILRFVYVPCPHTKEVLCEVLLETLYDWNLDRKLSTVTVDNCTTNDAMITTLLRKLSPDSLMLYGTLLHLHCCAHILNLIVKDGLDIIKGGIDKIRDSVAFWRGTPKREEKFEETAHQLRISCNKKLGLDCATRWNSIYLMLQTALVYKNVFFRLHNRESLYKTYPSEEEWAFAKEVCGRLKLFYNVTELFSGTKYPTANIYFPKICEIRMALTEWLTCSSEMVRDMAKNMVAKFDKYWSVIHGIMGVAAVLDPRYKMTLLEYYFPILFGSEADGEIERVANLCYDLLREYQNKAVSSDSSFCPPEHSEVGDHDTMSGYDLFVHRKKQKVNVKSELDHYLEEDVLPRSSDFDILAWWKSNGLKYPTLQSIARDVLSIPVSTVASESAFSTSGRLVSPHRSRLHPNTLEALMCAQNWLWAAEMRGELNLASDGYATIFDDVDCGEEESCITVD